jgi:4'-phosphopantetheinyl transferase
VIAWDLRSAQEHPTLAAGEPPDGLLSAPERVFFDRLKTARRQREWLLGRWVSKALCRAWLAASGQLVPASSLTIAPDEDGAPFVLQHSRGRLPVTVSISHREEWALCALSDGREAPLGADLEKCEPRSPGFAQDFFTVRELACLDAPGDRDRRVTEIWSLKEAALKAIRLGLSVDTRTVQANPREHQGLGWEPASVDLGLPNLRAHGWAFVRDESDFVATIAWLGATPVDAPSDALRGYPVLEGAMTAPGPRSSRAGDGHELLGRAVN